MTQESALLKARIEAGKIAATVAENNDFWGVYKYMKEELEDALRLVDKGMIVTKDGTAYVLLETE